MASPPFGRLVRHTRQRLEMSQETLAERAGISPRHLSFLENGRSQPSREVAMEIASALGVPLHETGAFLESAGYRAPSLEATPDAVLGPELKRELALVLDSIANACIVHDRYGAVLATNTHVAEVIGRVVTMSGIAMGSTDGHALLAGLQPVVENWTEVQDFYRRRLFAELLRAEGSDPELERLYRRWSEDAHSVRGDQLPATVPLLLNLKEFRAEFRLLTATLGTPNDVALRDLRIVLILPMDEGARRLVSGAV